MADNTILNPGTGGDTLRDLARQSGTVKTQVMQLDIGGASENAEVLVTAGQRTMAASLPVVIASDQPALPVTGPLTDTQLRANPVRISGIRRDADTAYVADLAEQPLMFNDGGRLKVSVTPADIAQTVGAITANGGVVAMQIKRLSNLSISMVAAALAGHNIAFEASNNTTTGLDGNWYSVQVVRSNANTVEIASGVLAATPIYMWQVNVSDYAWFRVRATTHTSGTANYTLNPSAYVSEPIPAVQVSATQPVTGSVTSTPLTPSALNVNSAATTNATLVKALAGTLFNISASNSGAATAFLKLYNKATAPVVGTDVPVLVLPIPAASAIDHDLGMLGQRFLLGIGLAITNLMPDTDTTAVAASQVKVLTSFA